MAVVGTQLPYLRFQTRYDVVGGLQATLKIPDLLEVDARRRLFGSDGQSDLYEGNLSLSVRG